MEKQNSRSVVKELLEPIKRRTREQQPVSPYKLSRNNGYFFNRFTEKFDLGIAEKIYRKLKDKPRYQVLTESLFEKYLDYKQKECYRNIYKTRFDYVKNQSAADYCNLQEYIEAKKKYWLEFENWLLNLLYDAYLNYTAYAFSANVHFLKSNTENLASYYPLVYDYFFESDATMESIFVRFLYEVRQLEVLLRDSSPAEMAACLREKVIHRERISKMIDSVESDEGSKVLKKVVLKNINTGINHAENIIAGAEKAKEEMHGLYPDFYNNGQALFIFSTQRNWHERARSIYLVYNKMLQLCQTTSKSEAHLKTQLIYSINRTELFALVSLEDERFNERALAFLSKNKN